MFQTWTKYIEIKILLHCKKLPIDLDTFDSTDLIYIQ